MKNNRLSFIDFIRSAAMIGVIIIHSDNITASYTNYLGGVSWWIVNILQSFSRFAVPLFIMISGYLLLHKQYSLKGILHKTWSRILIPLLFWYGFYFWWREFFHHDGRSLWDIVQGFLSGNMFHLYFLWIIVGLYSTLPLWQKFINQIEKQKFKYIIFLFFVLAIVQGIIDHFIFSRQFFSSALLYFIPYVSYFLWGGYLAKFKPKFKQKALLGIFLLSGLGLAIGHYLTLLIYNSGNFSFVTSYYIDYWFFHFNILIVVLTASFFLLAMGFFARNYTFFVNHDKKIKLLISNFAQSSFAIYLIHPFVLDLVDVYLLTPLSEVTNSLWLYFFQRVFYVLVFSYVLSLIFRKIPFIKKVVGEC